HPQARRCDRGRLRGIRRQPGRGPEDLRGRAQGGRVRPRLPGMGRVQEGSLTARPTGRQHIDGDSDMADAFGYHIDHHGSLVRPASLLAARASGLSGAALAAATHEAVVTLAHELRPLTLNAMSDGQFRRGYLESVVHDQVAGFAPVAGPTPLADLAGISAARVRAVPAASALAAAGRLAQAEAAPVLATVDR